MTNRNISRYSGIIISGGVIGILGVMIMPLPTGFLDVLLAINITTALLIIMVAMYTTEPLRFSVFPGLLLLVTLFRLSLNIASTRLILAQGYAGHIIEAFGSFVVQGNYVVGFIIFLILVIINFVVITKGAGRIAEVAARFTLDAMPGKQMSIDADLNAGLIDDNEARARRLQISQEADFYGAMDGASKFVRGDAIAGLLITVINIFGGLLIGIVQNGMSFSEALQTYSRLTVGDGLVSQIPALIISTAAGLIMTRAAAKSNVGEAIVTQLLAQPRPLFIAAVVILAFALAPGLPTFPFLVLSALTGGLGYFRLAEEREAAVAEAAAIAEEKGSPEEEIEAMLRVDPLELEIGYELISLVDEGQGGDLLERIGSIRKQLARELGIVLPAIRIRDNLQLKPGEYVLRIRGNEVGRNTLEPTRLLALSNDLVTGEIPGIRTKEPTFGMPAVWINEDERNRAEQAGYTVVDAVTVLATHLMATFKSNAHVILSRQETQSLIDSVKKEHPTVVEELIPKEFPVGVVQKVLQNLLRERIPIRDLVSILEALSEFSSHSKDPQALTELVRSTLSEVICQAFKAEDGRIYAIAVDPSVEKEILDAAGESGSGYSTGFSPARIRDVYRALRPLTKKMEMAGRHPALITVPQIRPYLRALVEPMFPTLAVLSYSEVTSSTEIESTGMLSLRDED